MLRQTVIEEIVSTEADYVADLDLLVSQCLKPARARNLFSDDDERQLFHDVEKIWQANTGVLKELQERAEPGGEKSGLLGDVLERLADTLRSYADYAANQDTSVAAYLRLKEDPVTQMHMEQLEKAMHGHDLCGYLIKPVQRLCKVCFLLFFFFSKPKQNSAEFSAEFLSFLTTPLPPPPPPPIVSIIDSRVVEIYR